MVQSLSSIIQQPIIVKRKKTYAIEFYSFDKKG